jgi:aerobic-type carbon monoxide dehydrogenase small subunit (CoxS/CutS family)
LSEEKKSRTLQDCAERNRNFNGSTITTVPELSKEEIKEKTLSQEEHIINDSYSASATVVSEEAVLKEAEPETDEEIESFENKEIYEEDQVGL